MKMKMVRLLLLCLIFTRCSMQEEKGTIITNINIIPIWKDTILLNHDIKIISNKIVSIGKNIKKNNNDTIINGRNSYVIPGFWDMHTHLPNKEKRGFGYKQYLALNFLSGITNIRNMREFDSIPTILTKIKTNAILAPNIYFSPTPITSEDYPKIDSIQFYVKKYKLEGFKYWKILNLPKKVNYYDTLIKYTRKHHLKLTGHVPLSVGLEKVINHGYSCIEHLQGYNNFLTNTMKFETLLQQTKKNNVFNCATLDWYHITYLQYSLENIYNKKYLKYIPKATVKEWKKDIEDYLMELSSLSSDSLKSINHLDSMYIVNKMEILKKLHNEKCKLLISPDASGMFQVPGFSFLEELKLYEKVGISKYEILKMATYNAAEWMGEENTKGAIKKGMDAELILYSKNPLIDLNNLKTITGIYFNNLWFDGKTIEKKLKVLEDEINKR